MSIFITGIGTDVGKTYVSCQLIKYAKQQGTPILAYKPIVSGYNETDKHFSDSDPFKFIQAQGGLNSLQVEHISPWRFKAPLSPDRAAALENKTIDFNELIKFCQDKINQHAKDSKILIEGVGGLMVPLSADALLIDWIKALKMPCVLVGSTYLGAVNHTLMSIALLKSYKIPIKMLLINEYSEKLPSIGLEETLWSLKPYLVDVPYQVLSAHQTFSESTKWMDTVLS